MCSCSFLELKRRIDAKICGICTFGIVLTLKAKDSLLQLRYEVPELPQSYYDDLEKRALEFLKTVDTRCS